MRAAAGVLKPRTVEPPMVPDAPWEVRLGQRYRVSVETLHTSSGGRVRLVGTVVWIHPKGRFAMVACPGPKGVNLVECYHRTELTRENRVR